MAEFEGDGRSIKQPERCSGASRPCSCADRALRWRRWNGNVLEDFPKQTPPMSTSRTRKVENLSPPLVAKKGETGWRLAAMRLKVWPSDPGVDRFPEGMQQPIPSGRALGYEAKGATDRRVMLRFAPESTMSRAASPPPPGRRCGCRRRFVRSTSLFSDGRAWAAVHIKGRSAKGTGVRFRKGHDC